MVIIGRQFNQEKSLMELLAFTHEPLVNWVILAILGPGFILVQ